MNLTARDATLSCQGNLQCAAVIPRDVKDGRSDWCSTETNQRRKPETKIRAQFERGTYDKLQSLGSACAKANRLQNQGSRRLLDLCRRHRSDISCAPSADALHSNAERRLALRGTRQTGNQATGQPKNGATGSPSGKPTAMSAKTAQNLRQRSDAAMA